MRNVLLIIKQEIRMVMGKRSFWIMTFIFPLIIMAFSFGSQFFTAEVGGSAWTPGAGTEAADSPAQIGYVDQAGVIETIPPALEQTGLLRAFPNREAADAAMDAGEIGQYLLVPAAYLESGELVLVEAEFNPMGNTNENIFHYLLTYNLVEDEALATALLDPTPQVQTESLLPETANGGAPANGGEGSMAAMAVPFLALFIFFFLLATTSGYMLQSVSREKENRTMEVLLVSLEPRQMMLGKVVGLGLVGLFQVAVWVGVGLLVLSQRIDLPNLPIPADIALPPGFLPWALAYFLLGYFMYAALMSILGALAPNAREAGQFTFIILLPLLIPIWLNGVLTQDPHGALAVALSLFPFTAPAAMMSRLATGGVSLPHLAGGLAGLAVTAYLCVWIASRFFRADTLLSFAPMEWRRFWREWRAA